MSADAEAMASSATMALRASVAPPRHCPACGAELPYLGGRGRPRRWCDAHHPRPVRLRPRAAQSAGVPVATRPRRVRGAIRPPDLVQVHSYGTRRTNPVAITRAVRLRDEISEPR